MVSRALPAAQGAAGWLSCANAPVVARTAACLNEDGGVRRLADVQAELADVEISAGNFRLWLQANGSALVHNLAVSAKGPLADVVERLLDAHGEARTLEQITGDIAGGRAPGRRRRPGTGGRRPPAVHPVLPWARGPGVVGARKGPSRSEGAGHARKQGEEKRAGSSRPPESVRGASGERLWLWVRVDADVLRGCEAAVPVALVEGLGLLL